MSTAKIGNRSRKKGRRQQYGKEIEALSTIEQHGGECDGFWGLIIKKSTSIACVRGSKCTQMSDDGERAVFVCMHCNEPRVAPNVQQLLPR